MEKELQKISGEIINYIYENEDSMYKVAKLMQDENEIIITGAFPHLDEGLIYDFVGYYNDNPKYGKQFYVESYAKSNSYTKTGLINYLSSDRFYGVGKVTATEIVDKLGLDCINLILNDMDLLLSIKGITKAKAMLIYDSLAKGTLEEEIYIKLYSFGLTSKMVSKLFETYGTKALNIIEENPYILINDVEGFGFRKSDDLALRLGISKTANIRIDAAILYTITNICYSYGFTFLTYNQLINSTIKLFSDDDIKNELIEDSIARLIDNKKLIYEDDRIYDYSLYKAENNIKTKLVNINKNKDNINKKEDVINALNYVEELLNISYTPQQKEAIILSLSSKLSVITGGPGTGKSTILKGIIHTYAKLNNLSLSDDLLSYKVLMASPTGRAAKRMHDASSFNASTIHKALGYNPNGSFMYDNMHIMSYSLVIIDEASMLDVLLAESLFSALSNSCQIILIGDSNQLPAVGPGNLLSDVINSNIFKVTRLNQIMRQEEGSNIIKLSSMVLQKRIDYRIFSNKKEVFLYPCDTKNIMDLLFKLLDNFIEKGGDLQKGIQILIPMYKGPAGIDEINKRIQEKYNDSTNFITRDDRTFKVGDKVIQTKNDHDLDIMNGDLGKIIDISKDEKNHDLLIINFDERIVRYPVSNIDSLQLAYAISIHKAQGSEFPNVIIPLLKSYNIMLKPKLIYTAITRAKEKVIILGNKDAIDFGLSQKDDLRQTTLTARINDTMNEKIYNKILDPSIPFDTFGEYDMDGITPYTFME